MRLQVEYNKRSQLPGLAAAGVVPKVHGLADASARSASTFSISSASPGASGGASREAVSVVGVEGDLLKIAQAERVYFAENNSYPGLGELTASGTLSLPRAGHDGYTYSVETTPHGFIATARYTGRPGDPPGLGYLTIVVDQTMQVRQSP